MVKVAQTLASVYSFSTVYIVVANPISSSKFSASFLSFLAVWVSEPFAWSFIDIPADVISAIFLIALNANPNPIITLPAVVATALAAPPATSAVRSEDALAAAVVPNPLCRR